MNNTLERITSDEDIKDYLEGLKQRQNQLTADILGKYTPGTTESLKAIKEYLEICSQLDNREVVSEVPY